MIIQGKLFQAYFYASRWPSGRGWELDNGVVASREGERETEIAGEEKVKADTEITIIVRKLRCAKRETGSKMRQMSEMGTRQK